MNVYDKAYELAKALKECPEAAELRAARLAAEQDQEAKLVLDDFRERQNALQQQMMSGEEPSEEEMEAIGRLYEDLAHSPLINRLFEAERRFVVVYEDVNRIMSDVLKSVLD
ncbi:YlbF family regulator [Paenibacillus cisolokensis]|uniref:YlbF family regulator n=1 Tax=Paenibacillus cisolokensis TaxID=1658519 RepID=UPI003D27B412